MTEHVILLDEAGNSVGVADKATVHTEDTPLHLAFSCYLFGADGQLLLSQRAWEKKTWPGVWTNSCCGHPAPGEAMVDGVRRRLRDELGVGVTDVDLVLPRFRYRAVMDDGVVEYEMCPVFRAYTKDQPDPNPAEVADVRWTPWPTLVAELEMAKSGSVGSGSAGSGGAKAGPVSSGMAATGLASSGMASPGMAEAGAANLGSASPGAGRLGVADSGAGRFGVADSGAEALGGVGATLSPWCQLQLAELIKLGDEPSDWPLGAEADLPPAARYN